MTLFQENIKSNVSVNNSFNAEMHDYEVVERKGVGHPDTICDAIAEKASQYYSLTCLEKFGRLAHHWFDKVLLVGGESSIEYGNGRVTKPYEIIFAGKAAIHIMGETIDIHTIQMRACQEVLESLLHGFDTSRDLIIHSKITDYQGPGRKSSRYRPTTMDHLVDLTQDEMLSNDCNVCTGYAPLSHLEKMVVDVEKLLLDKKFNQGEKDIGVDIKIVGTRKRKNFHLLVNIPFIADFVPSFEYYQDRKENLKREIREAIKNKFVIDAEIQVNPADEGKHIYLTSTGTVADTGDVGVTGRGNRLNGLITPMRQMSIEASSGKNPIDHTGKIYGVLAQRIADRIYKETKIPVSVLLSTSKAKPVEHPDEVIINLSNISQDFAEEAIEKVVNEELQNSKKLSLEFVKDGIVLW